MKSRHLSTLALTALLGTAPAWAQSANTSPPPATNAPTNASPGKPLCSELGHPQAGKLAGKQTGMAKDHSASPVHQDCIPDAQASASGTNGTSGTTAGANAAAGTTAGTNASPGATASGSATASPSVTGSSSSVNSTVTGSSTDVNTSVTGSTSTFNPNIDLRGRSSLTIDNATSTGDQTANTTATTTTGNQASSNTATSTTGNQSATGSASQSSEAALSAEEKEKKRRDAR